MNYKLLLVSLFLSVSLSVFSQDSVREMTPDTTSGKFKQHFKVDSTGWIDVSHKLIVGCETSTNMSWFSFNAITENLDTALYNAGYEVAEWTFKSGYSPLTNSYYLATRFGKFSVYSHSILANSKISGNSTTRFASYGYSHLINRLNISLSYRNIVGYQRSCPTMNVADLKSGLRVKDYRLTLEMIGKGGLKYKKYGFSNLYFPVKISGLVTLQSETSYFTIYDPSEVIPNMSWQNNFVMHPGTFMKRFSMISQSFYMHFAEVMPFFKRKGDRPKCLFLKLDFIYGINIYRYYAYNYPAEKIKSDVRVVFMANTIGSLQLVYASTRWHCSLGIFGRGIKYNEFEKRDEWSFTYFYSYINLNLGYRIPFQKGYHRINNIIH